MYDDASRGILRVMENSLNEKQHLERWYHYKIFNANFLLRTIISVNQENLFSVHPALISVYSVQPALINVYTL